MIRRRTITSYVWNSVSGNKMVILSNCIRNFFRKFELIGNSVQGENPAPDNPQEIKSAGKRNEGTQKYEIDVKVTGRNILSDVKGMYNIFVPCLIKAGTTVTLITNGVESDGGNILFTTDSGEDYWYAIDKGVTKVARSINKNVIGFKNLLQKKDGLKYCLVIGDTDKYEPYTEQTVQIALDEPLRGVGEYKDMLTKDGVVRKIYEQTLKKERISMNEYNWDTKYFRLYVNPNNDKKIDSSINIHELFSNMFKKFVIYKNNPIIYWIISEEEIRSMGVTESDSREIAYEKIKDFVANNDIVVQYPIVETTLEPLSEFVQAQLSALHSENGATHVFVDSGEVEAGINIEYKYKS